MTQKRSNKRLKLILIATVAVVGSIFALRSSVVAWYDVPTGAMRPTILPGDRIVANLAAYDVRLPLLRTILYRRADPEWGDIVIFRSPEDDKLLVKRVVALPGDVVEVRAGRLYLNGTAAEYSRLAPELIEWDSMESQASFLFASEKLDDRKHAVMITLGTPSMPFGPYQVPDGHYFVLGDNRSNSRDSRWYGAIPRESILGRATSVALSVHPGDGYKPRWDRWFSRLE